MWKTAGLQIVAECSGVLVPMPKCLVCGTTDLGFFAIVIKTRFDLLLAYLVLCHGQEVDCSCTDLDDPFPIYSWHTARLLIWQTNVYTKVKQGFSVSLYIMNTGCSQSRFGSRLKFICAVLKRVLQQLGKL